MKLYFLPPPIIFTHCEHGVLLGHLAAAGRWEAAEVPGIALVTPVNDSEVYSHQTNFALT